MKIGKEKIKSLSRILKVFFNILFWVSVATAAISSLFLIVTFFIDKSVFILPKTWEGLSITVGIMKFNIDPNLSDNINLKHLLQTMLPIVIVISSIFVIVNHNLRLILKTVADNRPFERNNAKRLFIIGIVLIISSVVWKITEGIFALTVINTLNIENIDVTFTVDVAMLLTGFLILILAGVFQYGSYLQEEYNATL